MGRESNTTLQQRDLRTQLQQQRGRQWPERITEDSRLEKSVATLQNTLQMEISVRRKHQQNTTTSFAHGMRSSRFLPPLLNPYHDQQCLTSMQKCPVRIPAVHSPHKILFVHLPHDRLCKLCRTIFATLPRILAGVKSIKGAGIGRMKRFTKIICLT